MVPPVQYNVRVQVIRVPPVENPGGRVGFFDVADPSPVFGSSFPWASTKVPSSRMSRRPALQSWPKVSGTCVVSAATAICFATGKCTQEIDLYCCSNNPGVPPKKTLLPSPGGGITLPTFFPGGSQGGGKKRNELIFFMGLSSKNLSHGLQ